MEKINNFYLKVSSWLYPMGYTDVYSNHPGLPIREFHFSKDGIRVICVISNIEEYCYLHKENLGEKYILSTASARFPIGFPEIEDLHEFIKSPLLRSKGNVSANLK